MTKVLPVVLVCSVGIAVCLGVLIFYLIKFLLNKRKKKTEEFELEENVLTIDLSKNFPKKRR